MSIRISPCAIRWRRTLTWGALVVCFALFAGLGPAQAQTTLLEGPSAAPVLGSAPRIVEDHLIVRFATGADASERSAAREAAGAEFLSSLGNRTQLVEVETDLDRAEAQLEARDDVLYAEPDFLYEKAAVPNDNLYSLLWGLNNTGQSINGSIGTPDADIDAPEAWDERTDSSSATVAVVDSGITRNHTDLSSEMWSNPDETAGNGVDDDRNGYVDDTWGWDFHSNDATPVDEDSHGTHVAGTIGARGNDGSGVAGVAWKSRLMSLRVCDNFCPNSAIVAAFNYAPSEGARVVNASLGGGSYSQALSDAITTHPDTLYVVAAGNGGDDGLGDSNDATPYYPCSYPGANLICVGATDQFDQPARFSNFGTASVDISAPGVRIYSSAPEAPTALALDSFEAEDFATNWTARGFSRTNEAAGAVSGFHATDSPGAPYAPNASATLESRAFNTTDAVDCKLRYDTSFGLGAGDVLLVEAQEGSGGWREIGRHAGTGSIPVVVRIGGDTTFENKSSVRVRFRLAADAVAQGDGFHVDNVKVDCVSTAASSWHYKSGTSMATPHVAGSAALIFAKSPAATPRSVRHALLSGGDVKSSLATRNATGRRLNLKGALDALDVTPPDTTITSAPGGTTTSSTSFEFTGTEDGPGASFECKLDAGAWAACVSPKLLTGLTDGSHTFSVRAIDAAGNLDTTEAIHTFTADAAAPSAPTITSPSDGLRSRTDELTVSGTAEPSSIVELFDGATSKGTTSADGGGAWSKRLTGVSNGAHTYTAKATDAAGNPSARSNLVTITVDTSAPTADPVDPGPQTTAPRITGGSSAGRGLVSSKGVFTLTKVRVDCLGQGSECAVKATVTGTIGRSAKKVKLGGASLRVAAGKSGKVKVRLTGKGLKLLKRLKRVQARVAITVTRGDTLIKKTVKVTLTAPKKKRR